jgi:hypothetical protein
MSFDDGENVGGTSQESKRAGNSDDPQAWLTMCREILSADPPPDAGLRGFVSDKLIKLAAGVEPFDGLEQGALREIHQKYVVDAAAQAPGAFKLHLYDEIDDEFVDDPVIEDLVQRGEIVCLWGASGVYKSAIALDMSLHVAAGRSWCGRQTVPGFVCCVAAEAGKAAKARIIAWRKKHPDIPRGAGLPWGLVQESIDLHQWGTDDATRLATAIKQLADGRPVQMVLIDTASCVLRDADENLAKDAAAFIECLKQLSAELGGAAILFVHHTGKDEDRGERGSYVFRANSDVSLAVEKDMASAVSTVEIRKARDGEEGHLASFKVEAVEIGTTKFGKPMMRIVAMQCEDAPATAKRKPLTEREQLAFNILGKLIDAEGSIGRAAVSGR